MTRKDNVPRDHKGNVIDIFNEYKGRNIDYFNDTNKYMEEQLKRGIKNLSHCESDTLTQSIHIANEISDNYNNNNLTHRQMINLRKTLSDAVENCNCEL